MAQTGATDPTKETNTFQSVLDVGTKIIVVAVFLLVFFIIARLVAYRIIEAIKKNQKEQEYQEMMVLSNRLVYIIFLIIALAIGLGVTNLFEELGWLLGAVGLGIGFALQTIIGNYIAGLTLLIQRKMHMGDLVEIEGSRGLITSIGSRAVTVHNLKEGIDILVPNLDFFKKQVKIFTANPYRRIWVDIGVGYDTDFVVAYEKIFEILKRYPDIQQEPHPDVLMTEIKDSSVNLRVRWWIPSNMRWWTIRSNILRDVFVELQTIGVDISFPIRTLRIDSHESDALYDYVKKEPVRSYEGPGIRAPTHKK
jgi:small-conductance mechanosensitive channel